uniref:RxLR effector candidate protein n=1 Tax=Hyaloperonospora arabidopsidis (strain Emoy2) TaxID=559515 RepID=M4BPJ8_HYAAE
MPNVGCDQPSVILLEQASNGINWLVATDNVADRQTAEDCRTLEAGQHNCAIVFQAHSRLHGIPWSVSNSVANPHVHLALNKQPFKRFKGSRAALSPLLMKLRVAARRSAWQTAVLQQTPATLWAHGSMLTAFQVWVNYRMAAMQLNLYHPGRAGDPVARSYYVPGGKRNGGTYVLVLPMRAGVLAEAYLSSDRRTLGDASPAQFPS